jgi:hypothetical protein
VIPINAVLQPPKAVTAGMMIRADPSAAATAATPYKTVKASLLSVKFEAAFNDSSIVTPVF